MELLWADRQLPPNAALLRRDLPGAAQVAQPAEPAPKCELAGVESPAGTFPSAPTAHCGKERSENALPAGTEFLPTAAGLPATEGKPAGVCESELT